MLILCLAWRDKGKCLVAKLKSGLATKLDKDFTKTKLYARMKGDERYWRHIKIWKLVIKVYLIL